jgi:hypothetical protein
MAAIITKDTRLLNAKAFVESVSEAQNTVYYVFLGKPTTWPIEYAPPQAVDDYATQRDIWDNMEAMKLVTTNDVIHAIPRYNWTAGNVYAHYNDRIPSANLFDYRFHVINSQYNVYKCLSNGGGNVTINEPTGTGSATTGIIENRNAGQDGYIWKYMYNIPVGTWVKFGTTSFIPVVNVNSSVSTLSANNTGIYAYNVLNANVGSNNPGTGFYYAKIVGTGDDTANATVRITNGNVANVFVNIYGNSYTKSKITSLTALGTGTSYGLGNVVIEPILSPPGGHGSDTYDELGAIYAMVNVRFEQTDAPTIPVENFKFRQIGVLKDPTLNGTEKVPTLTTANTLLRAYSNVTIDGVITNSYKLISGATLKGITSGANATVVSYVGNVINYIQAETSSANVEANFKSFLDGENLYVDSIGVGQILELGNAAVNPRSGEIIYIDNRNVITRATDQVEDVFVVIEF